VAASELAIGRERAARSKKHDPGRCACRLALKRVFSCRLFRIGMPGAEIKAAQITEQNF